MKEGQMRKKSIFFSVLLLTVAVAQAAAPLAPQTQRDDFSAYSDGGELSPAWRTTSPFWEVRGVVAGDHATDCLVENNTFFHLRHAMMTKQGANGNVFGYNASFLNYAHEGARSYGRLCDISQHGHFSYMNLFEGNVVQFVTFADWWGPTGPQSTCFRNRVLDRGIEVKDQSHAQNVLANTLLGGGIAVEASCRDAWVEKNLFVKSAVSGRDALTVGPGPTGWKLPASLYLAGKPAWWGDRPWPAIGADVDRAALADGQKPSAIPAEQRYHEVGLVQPGGPAKP
jgi:hypothetical protein